MSLVCLLFHDLRDDYYGQRAITSVLHHSGMPATEEKFQRDCIFHLTRCLFVSWISIMCIKITLNPAFQSVVVPVFGNRKLIYKLNSKENLFCILFLLFRTYNLSIAIPEGKSLQVKKVEQVFCDNFNLIFFFLCWCWSLSPSSSRNLNKCFSP